MLEFTHKIKDTLNIINPKHANQSYLLYIPRPDSQLQINMSAISDITDTEKGIVQTTLDERWSKNKVELQIVDVEARLSKADRELTECPALYWEQGECHFIIIKTDDSQYRTQFYYGNREQFGTSIPEYDNLGDCVLSLLRLQADHELSRAEEQDT